MVTFGDFVLPKTSEEAYLALKSKKKAKLVGGGCWIRMGKGRIALAIDLSEAGLDYIIDNGQEIEIGAMTSLREIETSELLKEYYGEYFKDALKHIIGVQLRSIATIGGTVYSKFGFSDPITALLAIDADVYLYEAGRMSLENYLKEKGKRRDLLEKIIIKKEVTKASFQTIRNSDVDYAILSAAVAKKGDSYRISVGARPLVAALAYEAMDSIKGKEVSEELAKEAGLVAAAELRFGKNCRGSAAYRYELCKTLVKRGLMEVGK